MGGSVLGDESYGLKLDNPVSTPYDGDDGWYFRQTPVFKIGDGGYDRLLERARVNTLDWLVYDREPPKLISRDFDDRKYGLAA